MSGEESIWSHLEAHRRALWRSVFALVVLLIPAVWIAPYLIELLVRRSFPPGEGLHYFKPMEPVMVQLEVGFWLAFAVALPVTFWQFGRFAAPGLYRRERRALFWCFATALALFALGAAFGLFLIVPLMTQFSWSLGDETLRPVIGLANYVDLVMLLLGGFGVMFELPVAMVVLVRLGLVRSETFSRQRPLAVAVILLLAAVLTPPDVVSQLLMAIPTWLLFEAAIWVCRRVEPRPADEAFPEEVANLGPAGGGRRPPEPERSVEPEMAPPEDASGDDDPGLYLRAARKKRKIRPVAGVKRGSRRWRR